MRRQRISRRPSFSAVVLLAGLLLHPIGNAQAELEFISQNIGYPVQYFEPVDVEGDGIWELAVQVGHVGDSVGVYSPLLQLWIDGPHYLPVEGNDWGCGDFDDDSTIQYIYLVGKKVMRFDPATMQDTLLFQTSYTPFVLQVWGKTEISEPLINLCHHKEEYKQSGGWPILYEGTKISHWLRYSVVTGILVDSLDGWKKRGIPCFVNSGPSTPYLCVFDFNYYYRYYEGLPLPTYYECGYSIAFLSQQSPIIYEMISIQNGGFEGEWPSCYPQIEINHMVIGHPINSEEYEVFWQLENSVFTRWLIGAKVSSAPSVTWSVDIEKKPYAGLAYHDIDSNGVPELLLPLRVGNFWEIRDPQTGTLIDSIPGLPPADIRTAPIMETDVLDLYYFVDSTLYILNRPGLPVSVFEVEEKNQIPVTFTLHQNYPNPFNTSTVIKFDLDQPASVKLDVYNILGQKVATLLNASLPSGFHQVEWDGKNDNGADVVSGIYFYRLTTDDFALTKKMVFLR